jgi:hypothetical protein
MTSKLNYSKIKEDDKESFKLNNEFPPTIEGLLDVGDGDGDGTTDSSTPEVGETAGAGDGTTGSSTAKADTETCILDNGATIANYNTFATTYHTPIPFIKDSLLWYYINSKQGKKLRKWINLKNNYVLARYRHEDDSGKVIKYGTNYFDEAGVTADIFNDYPFTKYINKIKKITLIAGCIIGFYILIGIISTLVYKNPYYIYYYHKTVISYITYILLPIFIICFIKIINKVMGYSMNEKKMETMTAELNGSQIFPTSDNTLRTQTNIPKNSIYEKMNGDYQKKIVAFPNEKKKLLFYFNNYTSNTSSTFINSYIAKIEALIDQITQRKRARIGLKATFWTFVGIIILAGISHACNNKWNSCPSIMDLWIYSNYGKFILSILGVVFIVVTIVLFAVAGQALTKDNRDKLKELKKSLSSFQYCNN